MQAGFPRPQTFVAPHDKFSRASLFAAAKSFPILSSGWYELKRLPVAWWPRYAFKKFSGAAHWSTGSNMLLTHPGCLLSAQRSRHSMLSEVKREVGARRLTVLVTHWWEYFPN